MKIIYNYMKMRCSKYEVLRLLNLLAATDQQYVPVQIAIKSILETVQIIIDEIEMLDTFGIKSNDEII